MHSDEYRYQLTEEITKALTAARLIGRKEGYRYGVVQQKEAPRLTLSPSACEAAHSRLHKCHRNTPIIFSAGPSACAQTKRLSTLMSIVVVIHCYFSVCLCIHACGTCDSKPYISCGSCETRLNISGSRRRSGKCCILPLPAELSEIR